MLHSRDRGSNLAWDTMQQTLAKLVKGRSLQCGFWPKLPNSDLEFCCGIWGGFSCFSFFFQGKEVVYTIAFFFATSGSGDRPRVEVCHGGGVYFARAGVLYS